jgi:hypothetical protein
LFGDGLNSCGNKFEDEPVWIGDEKGGWGFGKLKGGVRF